MRDQDVDFACITEEDEELLPLQVRYGVTAEEATHREPLELALSQEEPETEIDDDGTWDDVDPEVPGVMRSRVVSSPDELDEEQVSAPAEQEAVHSI